MRGLTSHIWQEGMLAQKGYFFYELLPAMERRGVIRFRMDTIPGNREPLRAPAVMIGLADR